MGAKKRLFLIPRTDAFRPDAESLGSCIHKLRDDGWISDPRQPWFPTMTFKTMPAHVHAATSGAYVTTFGEGASVGSFPAVNLTTWFADRNESDLTIAWPVENLGEEPAPLRYPLSKPSPLPPKDTYYRLELWLRNTESKLPGGVAFRFAFVVDCGSCWPRDPGGLSMNVDLRDLFESHFHRSFQDVPEVY